MNNFEALNVRLAEYRKVREWDNLDPGDLAKSIMIEAAELLEHFQWDSRWKENNDMPEKDWDKIGSEVADVFIYLMEFCQDTGIDLIEVTQKKMDYVEVKYPVELSKNSADYLKIKHEHRKRQDLKV